MKLSKLVPGIISVIIISIMLLLSACGGGESPQVVDMERELDHRSIRDIRTGVVLSIGDTKADIDRILGTPTACDQIPYMYDYPNGLSVEFEEDIAVFFISEINYFEIKGFHPSMEVSFNLDFIYDSEGNSVSMEEDAVYRAFVFFTNTGFDYIAIFLRP